MKRDMSHPHTHAILVPMTPSLEKLLAKAASKRGQLPETLVKKVLYDWLLADQGFSKPQEGTRADQR